MATEEEETILAVHSPTDDSDGEDDHLSARRMSQLSIETSEGEVADGELSDNDDVHESPSPVVVFGSLPVTPVRRRRGRRGKGRDGWVERQWERRRKREEGECRLLVRRNGRPGCITMDIDEVKACRELGIELQPLDWTVGFSGSALDTSSGGDSPVPNWRISNPGDNPEDVKARLKMWAHAVALASSTSFSG
ncbi:uncharacterized protein LOC120264565 [Dioscorea cayenensis subsp. rotundata]|uniref:Uncharacterized protein LOC120264565 n=1 Tax=Dioscorea cayennensis subsp. rotundata TaxID=55577 RepID=A0AB40BLK9_DIOCR|nr:uncharacterized protein LOC120264565 [Dioscorea cayenensis subsp. rotundata]